MTTLRVPPVEASPLSRAGRWPAGLSVWAVLLLTTLLVVDATGTGSSGHVLSPSSSTALMRAASLLAACGTIGSLVIATLMLAAPAGRKSGVQVRELVTSASRWAALWALTGCGSVAILVAQTGPGAVTVAGHGGLDPASALNAAVRASVLGAWAAGAVAVYVRGSTRLLPLLGCLTLAYLGLVPTMFVGHSGQADARLVAVGSMVVHVVAVTSWVGGLIALALHPSTRGLTAEVVRRFGTVALLCFTAVGVSGLANLVARMPAGELLGGGPYRALLVAKLCGFVVLGAFGAVHRRRTIRRLEAGSSAAFWALVAGEVVVMTAVLAAAVVLGRTAS